MYLKHKHYKIASEWLQMEQQLRKRERLLYQFCRMEGREQETRWERLLSEGC